MRLRYLIREAFINLKRNALVVLGAILAAFLSLLLVFASVVVAQIVSTNTSRWEDGIRLIAFLQNELSFEATIALREEVASWDGVEEVIYYSKADAYEEALDLFADEPAIRSVVEADPTFLPASLRIKPVSTDSYKAIGDRLVATPGVQKVTRGDEGVDRIRDIRRGLTLFTIVSAIVLAVVAVALIANTIRMAIYARREEIGIMKLVGAGNWFVRVPFLLEGMIEGLIGAALAVGLIFGLIQVTQDWQEQLPQWIDLEVATDFLIRWGLFTMAGGIAVGLLGSGIALRRFLRD